MVDWHELEAEKKRQQSELDHPHSATSATDPGQSKAERALQRQWIQERIEPFQEKIHKVIETWNTVVGTLLAEIAAASWGEQRGGRYSWTLQCSIIWSEESQTPSLYWIALHRQPYLYAWYAVELRTDLESSPLRFVIHCKESSYTISADLTQDALKFALIAAFRLGPLENIFYEPNPGVLVE